MTSFRMSSLPGSFSRTCQRPGMSLNALSLDCTKQVHRYQTHARAPLFAIQAHHCMRNNG